VPASYPVDCRCATGISFTRWGWSSPEIAVEADDSCRMGRTCGWSPPGVTRRKAGFYLARCTKKG
jgi:hypothetical protein